MIRHTTQQKQKTPTQWQANKFEAFMKRKKVVMQSLMDELKEELLL